MRLPSVALSSPPAASYVRVVAPTFVARPAASYWTVPLARPLDAVRGRLSGPYVKVSVMAPAAVVTVVLERSPTRPLAPSYPYFHAVSFAACVPVSVVSIRRPSRLYV